MQTAIQLTTGQRMIFITQQYEVGLYVAIYRADDNWMTHGIPLQRGVQAKEKSYHKKVRATAEKNKDIVDDTHSTPL